MTPPERVLQVARGQLGYTECISEGHRHTARNHTRFGRWYGLDGEPWCAMFVSWCEHEAGFPFKVSTSKGYAYTPAGVAYFRRINQWTVTDPRPGDHGFLYYRSLGRVGHVFLVERVEVDHVITIEGNTNGAGGREGGNVLRKRRRIRDCYGFGRPVRVAPEPKEWDEMASEAEVRKAAHEGAAAAVKEVMNTGGQWVGGPEGVLVRPEDGTVAFRVFHGHYVWLSAGEPTRVSTAWLHGDVQDPPEGEHDVGRGGITAPVPQGVDGLTVRVHGPAPVLVQSWLSRW